MIGLTNFTYIVYTVMCNSCSGGSRIPVGGGANPPGGQHTILPIFFKKMHEMEKILGRKGEGARWGRPLGSATVLFGCEKLFQTRQIKCLTLISMSFVFSTFVFTIRLIRLGFSFQQQKFLYLNPQPTDSQSGAITITPKSQL